MMTESEFVNSLHANQRKAYWQLKKEAVAQLEAAIKVKDEALKGVLHCLQHDDEYMHPQAVACDWCDQGLAATTPS